MSRKKLWIVVVLLVAIVLSGCAAKKEELVVGMELAYPPFETTDEKGEPIFSESDIVLLGKKSADALDKVVNVASDLNGIGEEAIKELEKNSDSGLTSGFGSN